MATIKYLIKDLEGYIKTVINHIFKTLCVCVCVCVCIFSSLVNINH